MHKIVIFYTALFGFDNHNLCKLANFALLGFSREHHMLREKDYSPRMMDMRPIIVS